MKILAFTDAHGSVKALKSIEHKNKVHNPDIILCAGDISIFENNIFQILKKLNKLNKKIVIIHGNHEDASTFVKCSKLLKNIIFIHKNHFYIDDALFLGFGGGGFSMVDKEFENKISLKFKKMINENKNRKIILLTHAPPYRTRLDRLSGGHCGNKSFRNFVEKNRVDIMICGHIHENFGKEDCIKKTRIINPGPFGKIFVI